MAHGGSTSISVVTSCHRTKARTLCAVFCRFAHCVASLAQVSSQSGRARAMRCLALIVAKVSGRWIRTHGWKLRLTMRNGVPHSPRRLRNTGSPHGPTVGFTFFDATGVPSRNASWHWLLESASILPVLLLTIEDRRRLVEWNGVAVDECLGAIAAAWSLIGSARRVPAIEPRSGSSFGEHRVGAECYNQVHGECQIRHTRDYLCTRYYNVVMLARTQDMRDW